VVNVAEATSKVLGEPGLEVDGLEIADAEGGQRS